MREAVDSSRRIPVRLGNVAGRLQNVERCLVGTVRLLRVVLGVPIQLEMKRLLVS